MDPVKARAARAALDAAVDALRAEFPAEGQAAMVDKEDLSRLVRLRMHSHEGGVRYFKVRLSEVF